MKKLILIVVLTGATCVAQAEWAKAGSDKHSLKGLQGLGVIVAYTDHSTGGKESSVGLTEGALKVAAELRLRRNGIRVIRGEYPGLLYLDVESICPTTCTVIIRLELHQGVNLQRDPKIVFSALTWYHSMLVVGDMADSLKLRQSVEESVNHLVDEFSNDFLTENPNPPLSEPAK